MRNVFDLDTALAAAMNSLRIKDSTLLLPIVTLHPIHFVLKQHGHTVKGHNDVVLFTIDMVGYSPYPCGLF